MPNYAYHFARARGRLRRQTYLALLPFIVRRRIEFRREIPVEVFSYSGERALPEQVASIRSFLKHAGRPKQFTVVSDGTYSKRAIELLQQINPVVTVAELQAPAQNVDPRLASYLRTHPTGKQLALIMSLPRRCQALYLDSDVLFFPGADDVNHLLQSCTAPALYLPDCGFAGDERILREPGEKARPVNTGVLFLFKPIDWSRSIDRFLEMDGEPDFFTNQTMAHVTMHDNKAEPLDRAKYVLQLDDQFAYADQYAGPGVVLRHYVNPVRHKFWTSLTF
jgi:hypothetical protein